MLLSTTVVSIRILRPCTTFRANAICTTRFVYHFDYGRPERDPPAAHGFGIRHLVRADTGEVAIHQICADFALQNHVAPIANVLQDQ